MIQKPKGTRDFLQEASRKARESEDLFVSIAKKYQFQEIRYPMFEKTELFKRGVGDTTDVVQKEMFQVISSANLEKYCEGKFNLQKEGLALRPEGTASVVRSFIENKLYADAQPTKLFYTGSNFRNERPQAGRFREFTQFGIEALGSTDPFTDAEVIALAMEVINAHGITNHKCFINSIGCPECRPAFTEALKEFLGEKKDELCHDCQSRFDKNPLRILDCKVPEDQELIKGHPVMLDHLCDSCKDHFEKVKAALTALDVPYEVDPGIVRGLDYYRMTAFEIKDDRLGAQSTICGGGRYDGLVEQLGGPSTPGIGFGMGMDRLLIAKDLEEDVETTKDRGMLIVAMGDKEKEEAIKLISKLRKEGHLVELEVTGRSLKASFKYADKQHFSRVLILGEEEFKKGVFMVKNLVKGEQEEMTLEALLKDLEEDHE